jgi:hypothetical protein
MQQGSSAEPERCVQVIVEEDGTKVSEREAHYRDLITVDYERDPKTTGPASGTFRVSLANGERIILPTLKDGVSTAVAAVRQRTRVAKLG